MKNMKGVFTALVTPFSEGKVDYGSFERLLDDQIKNGIEGFVVNGTTAESPTLQKKEVREIFDYVKKFTANKVTLLVGTGSNSTAKTIEDTREIASWGADAALVVVPYYNKPPQRGLVKHFSAVADQSSVPVILYNVPGRTITSLTLESIEELSEHKNIVGLKEASGKIEFAKEIAAACGPDFALLSGDDGTYSEFLEAGGHGVISVASHIVPRAFADWTVAARNGDFEKGRLGIKKLSRLIDLLFCEANPIPVKKALQMQGLLRSAELRLPLVELEEGHAKILREEMKVQGLLK